MSITAISPRINIPQVLKNGVPKAMFNSQEMIKIIILKTMEFITIRAQMFFTYFERRIKIPKEMAVWATPNVISKIFIGEKNKFAKKTPITMPKKYFLLKTIK